MSDVLFVLTLAAAVGCATIGGVFFGFSSFVMGALARIPAPSGIAAMQAINLVVISAWFLGVFFGSALACLALGIAAATRFGEAEATYLLAGSLLYLVGTIGVTVAFNVPRNNQLAVVEPESEEAAAVWARYLREWTAWNTVRTVTALAAAVLFIIALTVS